VYLFGGMVVRYFFLGARGMEMVPNLDFWRDLPTLVRDGVRFLQNGCRVVPAPDDTYDAI
jgi:cation-dependent mannose-6-phosphate receptor